MNATTITAPADSAGADPSENTAWAAVLGRDHGYDGRFFYAVRSTGIYCRPSCPAKKPRRENVEFFTAGTGWVGAGGYNRAGCLRGISGCRHLRARG
jgi:AraC family transcriptional regulator of adaptative response/methylated-DNA-[protein]-cysteine methyltransferase